MGYSGIDGSPNIDELILVLDGLDYYPLLFNMAFGDPEITEERMQLVLAQFVRSIQSFDSKYDAGRAEVDAENTNLDTRMTLGGYPQFLDMTTTEQTQLFAFLRTLSSSDVYTNKKWSDPFDASGNMTLTYELRINEIQYSSGADTISLELSTLPGASYTLWSFSNLSSNDWSIFKPNSQSHPMDFRTVSGPFSAPDSPRVFFRFSEDDP